MKPHTLLTYTMACTIALWGLACKKKTAADANRFSFSVTYPADKAASQPFDGRLLVMLATNDKSEPRFQIEDGLNTQLVFGVNVEGWKAGETRMLDSTAFGYPYIKLSDIPPGEYYVQALLHKYETFKRADGHTVKLPMDRGEGQQWNLAPGNLYSKPVKMRIDPTSPQPIELVMDQEIAPIEPPKDSKYVKHVRIRSKLLSDFWGRDMYLGAHVLLPEGWDSHPNVKYPLAVFHGHFPADLSSWRTTPADTTTPCVYSERFNLDCYNHIQEKEAYRFYQLWTGPSFPRVIAIEIQHANPYYDDSYAVNSANLGPYGDAITRELIPYIEQQYHGIGQGWARFLYGGSTGGWEALAAQVFYPDDYNGCYAACPDPIDFRAYCLVNIYEDKNAYYYDSEFKRIERPAHRNYLGQIQATTRETCYRELTLGDKSRSGQQWDIWEAVYSPAGADGYPKPIWNKLTGEIDKEVAAYWRENYDLAYILKRDWPSLGPKLRGKIHLYCGDMDNYYLNNAVYLMEDFLKETTEPHYDGEVDYGDRAEHCWNGDHQNPIAISRLRYHEMFIKKWTAEVRNRAPKDADLKSWLY